MKILILGASGMLGNAMLRYMVRRRDFEVTGSVRSLRAAEHLPHKLHSHLAAGVDASDDAALLNLFQKLHPEVVINCVGAVKQLPAAADPLRAVALNALLPHRLSQFSKTVGARLIHVSTDCVFSGSHGNYKETDAPDARDLYGLSKLLGEVHERSAVTLRTSIIGHELRSSHGLVNWFLRQTGEVKGYTRAIFSGIPTVELARIISDFVIPNSTLSGLFHVGSSPISKFNLLALLAEQYRKSIVITPDEEVIVNRSLDSSYFQEATKYIPPQWTELVRQMYEFA